MQQLPAAFAAMGKFQQWVIYKVAPSKTNPGHLDKFPCDWRTGTPADAHNPMNWTTPETAIRAAATFGQSYGIGFVFTENDPFFFVDLDHAYDPATGQWKPHAGEFLQYMSGCAVELSVSGTGLHIFGTAPAIPFAHSTESPYKIGGFYQSKRFAAMTGVGASGDATCNAADRLPALVQTYWPPRNNDSVGGNADWTDGPCEDWNGPADDEQLLARALRSKSVAASFNGKASFADLWEANVSVLAATYPDTLRPYNESQADMALAQHLAFWTGRDCERIQRLMMQSKLKRNKWEDRDDYLERTIKNAIAQQREVLSDKVAEAPVHQSINADPVIVTGSIYPNQDEILNIFKGCVYVRDVHRVYVPKVGMLKADQFRVYFGGYNFALDAANERYTRDAWEAFTQSQFFRCPRVDSSIFKPTAEPGAVLAKGGVTYVNIYEQIDIPRKVGDARLFFLHLEKILPDYRDRTILLSYMAACVQYKGVKFEWAPFLQGVEGNGKTTFTRCVSEAIGRRYVHYPNSQELGEKFNAWLFDRIFIGVEDVYMPSSRQEVFEILKPMITGDFMQVRQMQTDPVMRDQCANFIFNSNHRNGLPKTNNDRRVCILFCAQQQKEDLARDGMTLEYFERLYNWLNREDGYAIVSELLHTWPIPEEFNPATICRRAPQTSTEHLAIAASKGSIEQELDEWIAQEKPGFCGGWISSIMLDRMLTELRFDRRISHTKRREILETAGYILHPALPGGRAPKVVTPDGGKPLLFIHSSAPAMELDANSALLNYERANTGRNLPFNVV